MTFRKLLETMQRFVVNYPGHELLDRQVVIRLGVSNGDDDDLHCGGLRSAWLGGGGGCTEEYVLVLDAAQDPDED